MTQRVAIVTGGSSGIGEATALKLAADGFAVYAAARRVDRMASLTGHGITVLPVDVTVNDSMQSLVKQVIADTGRIDVLVNNAGYGSYGSLEDVPIDEAKRQFEVNIFGLARLTQLVLPVMREQHDGYIVNISSVGGKIWEPLGSWYHATKFAVEGLSDSLRAEVSEFGIKVVIIQPGAIRTEWPDIAADNLEAISANTAYAKQAKRQINVLRKANTTSGTSGPEVVANAIAKSVASKKPKTRYAVGGGANSILMVQRLLPDRGFDRFIKTMYAVMGRS